MVNNGYCFLDMDGVLVDTLRGLLNHYNRKDNPYDIPCNKGRYDISDVFEIPYDKFWGDLGEKFWANLHPTWYASALVYIAEEFFGRKNVCFLTRPTKFYGCIEGKLSWIRNNFPLYETQTLIGYSKYFCAQSNSVLCDDSKDNVIEFQSCGGKGILMPYDWNHSYKENPITYFADNVCQMFNLGDRYVDTQ